MLRRIAPFTELAIFLLLIGAGAWLLRWQTNRLDAGAVATLVGALFGGAAVLLGNWINRYNEIGRAQVERQEQQSKLKTLIAAELVNIAAGLLGGKALVDAALVSVRTGSGNVSGTELAGCIPRSMTFTNSLSAELLILDKVAIDALVTLQSNLADTRGSMEEVIDRRSQMGLILLGGLANGIAEDLRALATCFEHIAPTRKLALEGKPAEFAILLLRRAATQS